MKKVFERIFDVVCGITIENKIYDKLLTARENGEKSFELDITDLNVSFKEFNKGVVWLNQCRGLEYKFVRPGLVSVSLEPIVI